MKGNETRSEGLQYVSCVFLRGIQQPAVINKCALDGNKMNSEKMKTAQRALERIHDLTARVGNFSQGLQTSSPILKRLSLAAFKDLQKITQSLLILEGANALECDEELDEVEKVVNRLALAGNGVEGENRLPSQKSRVASPCGDSMFYNTLEKIMTNMSELERTFSFQLALYKSKLAAAEATKCSFEQFTYGSSSFQIWKTLIEHQVVKNALEVCYSMKKRQKQKLLQSPVVVIFGSSMGLLGFFTHCLYPSAHVIGYEILPTLHAKALEFQIQFECGIETIIKSTSASAKNRSLNIYEKHANYTNRPIHNERGKLVFILRDMMEADIRDADAVILTSLCWDLETRKQVAMKLSRELVKPSSVVIDYQAGVPLSHSSLSLFILKTLHSIFPSPLSISTDTFSAFALDVRSGTYARLLSKGKDCPSYDTLSQTGASVAASRVLVCATTEEEGRKEKQSGDISTESLLRVLNSALDEQALMQIRNENKQEEKTIPSLQIQQRYFDMIDIVEGKVSWSATQKLYIYKAK